jgi:RNA polymerase sigma-70 factor (ECF subfamily)
MNRAAVIFEAERPILISLCYRMLGERSGAEDAVQEVWLKWAAADQAQIKSPAAWLRRVATNTAIDTLRAAQRRREIYVGPWLPEPVLQLEDQEIRPHFELVQECELALLWAMERLNEKERAAFILREAFDASYSEIAQTLGTSQAACRQLVSRSQKKLQDTEPTFKTQPEEVAEVTQRFMMAVMAEDFDAALDLLTPETIAISDGGAERRAARRPLVGGIEIMQLIKSLHDKAKSEKGWSSRIALVNGKPAVLRFRFGVLDSVTALAPDRNGKISWIYMLTNPSKLGLSLA